MQWLDSFTVGIFEMETQICHNYLQWTNNELQGLRKLKQTKPWNSLYEYMKLPVRK